MSRSGHALRWIGRAGRRGPARAGCEWAAGRGARAVHRHTPDRAPASRAGEAEEPGRAASVRLVVVAEALAEPNLLVAHLGGQCGEQAGPGEHRLRPAPQHRPAATGHEESCVDRVAAPRVHSAGEQIDALGWLHPRGEPRAVRPAGGDPDGAAAHQRGAPGGPDGAGEVPPGAPWPGERGEGQTLGDHRAVVGPDPALHAGHGRDAGGYAGEGAGEYAGECAGECVAQARAHQQAVVPLELETPAVLSRRATPSSAPGTREKCAHTPRFSRWTRPASTRVFRWWETVGWLSPSGTVRSHTQASPPSLAASNEITRSRAGSAIALSTEASPMASSAARGAVCSGAQQATAPIGQASSASSREAMVTGRTVMDPVSLLY